MGSLEGMNVFIRYVAIFRNRPGSYQNSTIWPFIEGRVIAALIMMGLREEAERMFEATVNRKGISEWYDPRTGEPRGSNGQLMSAASIIEAGRILSYTDR